MIALVQSAHDSEAIRRTVEDVLSQPEFQNAKPPEPSALAKAIDKAVEWLDKHLGISPSDLGQVLLYLLYAALALGIVWLIVQIVRRNRRTGEASYDPVTVRAERVADLLSRAHAAREIGDFVQALRLYFWALVIGLSERGDLEYRDAWTNRELLERGRPHAEAARVLAPLVPALDARSFGHVPAIASDVDELERLCRQWLPASDKPGSSKTGDAKPAFAKSKLRERAS